MEQAHNKMIKETDHRFTESWDVARILTNGQFNYQPQLCLLTTGSVSVCSAQIKHRNSPVVLNIMCVCLDVVCA